MEHFEEYLDSLGSSKFRQLWPTQKHVLDDYSTQFLDAKDVAIELPTGAGKTLIALLVGGKWLEKGKKVVILSANKTLARQMNAEAEALGLKVAYMEGRGEDIPAKKTAVLSACQSDRNHELLGLFQSEPSS